MIDNDLNELIAREKIRDVLIRYCWGVDQRDAAVIKSVYWPEALDDHGIFKGSAHEFADLNVEMSTAHAIVTHHLVGNARFEIDGDRAFVESYVIAYHRIHGQPESVRTVLGETYFQEHGTQSVNGHDYLAGGRYSDHFERRNGEWRIINRIAHADWDMLQPSSALWQEGMFKDAYQQTKPS